MEYFQAALSKEVSVDTEFLELQAGVAQLAEHNVANVVVVGSNPITRSGGAAHP